MEAVVPVPTAFGVPVHFLYRYHTNRYRYQHAISTGCERNFDLGVRARSSFDPHFEITNKECI